MSTPENNTDILSMEELLKLAEEAPTADDPVVMPDETVPPSEAMPIADAAVDAIVADMLGEAVPEETPAEEPADIPAEEPTEAFTEEPEEAPDVPYIPDIPDIPEAPAEESDEMPLEASSEAPDEIPAEASAEEPVEIPVEASAEEPVELPLEAPSEEAVEMPVEEMVDIPEDPMAMADGASVSDEAGNPILIPMNDDSAHCVLCVRLDAETLGLPIESGSAVMISDDTLIYPEGEALVTENLLTGEKEASPLNESVLAAFSMSMEHFATKNEAYTKRSLLFPWLLKSLANSGSDPEAADKINDYLSFIGCTLQYTSSGFEDGSGCKLSVAEAFRKLSERKI